MNEDFIHVLGIYSIRMQKRMVKWRKGDFFETIFFLPSTTDREENKISPSQVSLTLSIYNTLGHTQVKY